MARPVNSFQQPDGIGASSGVNPLASKLPNAELWEAAHATSAVPAHFAPVEVGNTEFTESILAADNSLAREAREKPGADETDTTSKFDHALAYVDKVKVVYTK